MIAWCRICRPGSVLGPQQHFLIHNEANLMAAPSKPTKELKNLLKIGGYTEMTDKEKEISINGDEGQATALLNKKKAVYGI